MEKRMCRMVSGTIAFENETILSLEVISLELVLPLGHHHGILGS
jgi:hypothetical protein